MTGPRGWNFVQECFGLDTATVHPMQDSALQAAVKSRRDTGADTNIVIMRSLSTVTGILALESYRSLRIVPRL